MDLAAMTPRLDISSTGYCLANVGTEYLVYQPNTGEFTVDLTPGTYSYEWFNPVAGSKTGEGSFTTEGGRKSFAASFPGDAVLYLKIKTRSGP
jgi:hypothetical protein